MQPLVALAATAAAGVVSIAPVAAMPPVAAGELLAEVAMRADQLVAGASRGWFVSYRTNDEHDRPAVSNGQVYLPQGTPPAGGWPVVSWGYGTAGVGDGCAASQRMQADQPPTLAVALSQPMISGFLSSGYAVVATDYIGLGTDGSHHYLSAKAEAHAVTDIVRAARATGEAVSRNWLSAGHSQGGHAALMANHLAEAYAPELDLHGTVAIAPASNAEHALSLLGPSVPNPGGQLDGMSSLLTYILYGLRASRPDLDVDSYLTRYGREIVDNAESLCSSELRESLTGTGPGTLLAKPVFGSRLASALTEYMQIPTSGWAHPVWIVHGTADRVVPLASSVALAAQLRGGGADVDLISFPGTGHFDVIEVALRPAQEQARTLLPPRP
ncbi:lipase family protein [Nocardia mangyaensis]|uniref:lipase family protein n=1 Tax=Nocardia mangyaensis TaxID=2213200 RepID=UPI0014306FDC|nr:lipase family protein [Nocardia mangyaensis]